MTHFDDDTGEMPRMHLIDEHQLDDERIEAILAGSAGAEHAALSAFVADVRGLASGPAPVPSASLANLFTHGFSTENGDLSATAASNVNGPATQAAGLPKWRKNIMDIKKWVAGLSLAGKLALGAGVVAAAGGGAGTVGALPDPIQHGFARVFDPISPLDIPDPESGRGGAAPLGNGDVTDSVVAAPTSAVEPVPTTEAVETPSTSAPVPVTTDVVAAEPTTEPATVPSVTPPPTTSPVTLPPVSVPATPPSSASTPTSAAPAPVPPPASGVQKLSLNCVQNSGWTGVVCHWSMPDVAGAEVYLLKTGPGATPRERIWGDNPTSYVDVHADGTNTYTYQIEVRTTDGPVVGRSGVVSVTMVPVGADSPDTTPATTTPTTAAPAPPEPTTTDAPEPAPASVESLSLSCQQNAGWTGVVCHWSMPASGEQLVVTLLKNGPEGSSSERIWGDNPTSYVDVHADGTNTYTYRILVRTAGGTVVGQTGFVSVTMVPV